MFQFVGASLGFEIPIIPETSVTPYVSLRAGQGNAKATGYWLLGSIQGGLRCSFATWETTEVYVFADAGLMTWNGGSNREPAPDSDGVRSYNGHTFAAGTGGLWRTGPRSAIGAEIAFRRFEHPHRFDANWIEVNFVVQWGG